MAEDTKEHPLLPLIIQPLVENAVVHGLENKEEKGLVTVNIYFTEEFLHVLVRDNGTGMDQMKLESLMASITDGNKKETKHVGLKNTYQRLRLFYGEDFAFRMKSRPNQGTEVEIILPRERDEKNA